MNVLKSLVIWEKSHRESKKQYKVKVSFDEKVLPKELDESASREDSPSNLANLEAHKSTIEAVISEVCASAILSFHAMKGIP